MALKETGVGYLSNMSFLKIAALLQTLTHGIHRYHSENLLPFGKQGEVL
jgi:hypothetical protein